MEMICHLRPGYKLFFYMHTIIHLNMDRKKEILNFENNIAAAFSSAISLFTLMVFVAGCQFGSITTSNFKQCNLRKKVSDMAIW